MTVRTRFAPSPTGFLHIGGARTALFSWLYARRHGGVFVLRIEDTDLERSTEASVQAILDSMKWLGLDADEGPFFQTHRFERYAEVIKQLLAEDKAYHCYCTREELDAQRAEQMANKQHVRYDGRCRERREPREGVPPVVRFKNPLDGVVHVKDLVRGHVTFANEQLDDLIIARSDGTPTYNFTVVVDDMDMKITHVIRGDDHLNNTPRQINMYKALNAEVPIFAHLPMILGPDGARLSKRHGAVSVMAYHEEGFLPHALLNYLVRLGWSHGDQEEFSMDEMVSLFDLADVNKSASTFNPEKLAWLNQQYIRSSDPAELAPALAWHMEQKSIDVTNGPALEQVIAAQAERVKTLAEMADVSRVFYEDFDEFDPAAAKKNLRPVVREPMAAMRARFAELEDWTQESTHAVVEAVAAQMELKLGKIAQPLRVAVTGAGVSPSIDITLALVGKEKALQRIDKALAFIEARASA